MRQTIYGDVEPGHVIEKSKELIQARHANSGGWIKEAPRFKGDWYGDEHLQFIEKEKDNRYRAIDSRTDEILMIQNPDAWSWYDLPDGSRVFIKAPAAPTGQFLERKKNNRPERSY